MPGITVSKVFLIFVVVSLGAFAAAQIQVDEVYAHRPFIVVTPAQDSVGRMCRVPESGMPWFGVNFCSVERYQRRFESLI